VGSLSVHPAEPKIIQGAIVKRTQLASLAAKGEPGIHAFDEPLKAE
jgi:hypothetical protein